VLGEYVGLIEGRPELDPITERPEAHVRVVIKLLPEKNCVAKSQLARTVAKHEQEIA
jgi:hypothetical protein